MEVQEFRQINEECALAISDTMDELVRAGEKWGYAFGSAHEAFSHIHEEFDELKEHVWTRQSKRDLAAMRREAIQVAAMAVKMAALIDAGKGRA